MTSHSKKDSRSFSRITTNPGKHFSPIAALQGEDNEDTQLLRETAIAAVSFLRSFGWCGEIGEQYYAGGVGGIVGLFLFHVTLVFEKNDKVISVNEWLWVIGGELPWAYMGYDLAPSPYQAIDRYADGLSTWAGEADWGVISEDAIQIECLPTGDNARIIRRHVDFLRSYILPRFEPV
ncbi:hypothetical protein [Silvibacterium dinghuense]|uniref:Uncharacterized protein n=1 Tax=Silvibacterium dinghuense TaxID=1560006 RepID=A0A4Q1SDI9_9BACT|nr:hypothetical protein [Silvibacterium dinghuense]RXS95121.1 hypothetical protein ESZ00_10950 [Silvibacterium dinghuense]GGH10814.1 hypothetical protein GCM10011586_29310 [Silvibacterium dinghuense]